MASSTSRARIREVLPNIRLGRWAPGKLNSITDVPGVLVHTESIQPEQGINTGVTTIVPRPDWTEYSSFAGVFSFNGCGELTGTHWINETGLLTSPIIVTSTGAVGDAYRGIMEYCFRYHTDKDGEMNLFIVPAVGETYDGFLSDLSRFAVTPEHIIRGIRSATADAVPEGNTGGGTGMICHRFKGGTGSSSRIVKGTDISGKEVSYTVGVLVQANYGATETFHVQGIPVGQIIKDEAASAASKQEQPENPNEARKDGSIIIVIATDAPLLPIQLQRLAKRATVGLGKVGGYGNNTSGDIFIAFSTANDIPFQQVGPNGTEVHPYKPLPQAVQMCDNDSVNALFESAADATEEAILNAVCMAQTLTGLKGRTVDALDLDQLKRIVAARS